MAQHLKTMGTYHCGCCGDECLIFSDNFNRANETFGPHDSTGHWADSGIPKFQIVSNELVCTTTGTGASAFAPEITYAKREQHYALSEWVKFKLPASGKFRLGLVISPPNLSAVDFLQAFAEFIVGSAETGCGTMRIMVPNAETGVPTTVGAVVPINGFFPGEWHKARLCIDWNLNLAIASIMAVDGSGAQSHHETVPHVTSSSGSNGPFFNIGGSLWVDRTITGTYTFDDYKLDALHGEHGYGYYYYYGDDKCSTCHPSGLPSCEEAVIDFPTTDCRWHSDGHSGGCWKGSWSGIDSTGMPDNTTRAMVTFMVPEGGGTIELAIGTNSATLVIDADGNATLTLNTGETTSFTVDLASHVGLSVCCDDGLFMAYSNSPIIHHEPVEDCSGEVCVTNGGMDLISFTTAHNLHDPGCECPGLSEDCCICINDTFQVCSGKEPVYAIGRIEATPNPDPGQQCDDCALLLDAMLMKLACAPPTTCDEINICQPQWLGGFSGTCVLGASGLEVGVSVVLFRSGDDVIASCSLGIGCVAGSPDFCPCTGWSVSFNQINLGHYPVGCHGLSLTFTESGRTYTNPPFGCCNLSEPMAFSFSTL